MLSYLKSYASFPDKSKGRIHKEGDDLLRDNFSRDRDRIFHSNAFRRLEAKTQVFLFNTGDHYRNRLTHSLEASQIARSIAVNLGLNESLTETVILAHDLGHAPFGHAGEEALNALMKNYNESFNHNVYTFKLITKLERKYADFDGLNLTWESLEGILKHNGPLIHGIHPYLQNYNEKIGSKFDLEFSSTSSLEAQVAAISDDIAYNNHDIDDGIRAGLFDLKDLEEIDFFANIISEISSKYSSLEKDRLIYEVKRNSIRIMIDDVIKQALANIKEHNIKTPDDAKRIKSNIICFSGNMNNTCKKISNFLMNRMYKHYTVNRVTIKAKYMVEDLFRYFYNNTDCLPTSWQEILQLNEETKSTVICDFVAGMTDNYAMKMHNELRSC